MIKILLVGASYSEHKGASALISATVDNLIENIPYSKFFFCSLTPGFDIKSTYIRAVTVIPCVIRNSTLELFLGAIWLKLSKLVFRGFPMTKFLNETDVFVDISGDSYSSIYGKTAVLAMGLRVISAKLLRKPIIFFCQSIGPFYGVDVFLAKLILNLVDFIIAREFLTAEYLKKLNINSFICADQAFLLKPLLNLELIPFSKNKPLIGINISQLIDSKFKLVSGTNKYRTIMSDFIDLLIEKYDANVLVIPEVRKREFNSYDDCYVSKIIINRLKHKERVSVIERDCSPSELKAIVSYCDILISPRFHIVIFALSSNIPSIAIAYSPKTYGIMDMLKQSEYIIEYKELTLDSLMKKVESLWINKDEIKQNLKENMVEVRRSAKTAANIVKLFMKYKK